MSCDHCCGADQLFDLKSAEKEKKKYLKKGPRGVTRKLVDQLSEFRGSTSTLLDIGGGIGVLQWHFLERGGQSSTQVDASSGYLEVARHLAEEKELEGKSQFLHGDFVDIADQVKPHDWVTLDKVVCCYPDYHQLLHLATEKSNRYLALSFPMGGPIARFIRLFGVLYMRIKNNPFRPYIHPKKDLEKTIESAGFKPVVKTTHFPWNVQVYERRPDIHQERSEHEN